MQAVALPTISGEYAHNGPMQITYNRDDFGLPTSVTDGRGKTFTNQFYDNGALKQTGRPQWWTYDPSGPMGARFGLARAR